MEITLTKNGNGLVSKVNPKMASIAVNILADQLINSLWVIERLNIPSDFETTTGDSTKVYSLISGKPLYEIKSMYKGTKIKIY